MEQWGWQGFFFLVQVPAKNQPSGKSFSWSLQRGCECVVHNFYIGLAWLTEFSRSPLFFACCLHPTRCLPLRFKCQHPPSPSFSFSFTLFVVVYLSPFHLFLPRRPSSSPLPSCCCSSCLTSTPPPSPPSSPRPVRVSCLFSSAPRSGFLFYSVSSVSFIRGV